MHRFIAAALALCASLPAVAADTTYDAAGLRKRLKDMGDGTFSEQVYVGGGWIGSPMPSAIRTGQARIAVTGTAVCLPSVTLANGIVVKALASNAAPIAVGAAGVGFAVDGTGTGYVQAPGEAMSIAIPNASLVCFNGAAGDGVTYAGN